MFSTREEKVCATIGSIIGQNDSQLTCRSRITCGSLYLLNTWICQSLKVVDYFGSDLPADLLVHPTLVQQSSSLPLLLFFGWNINYGDIVPNKFPAPLHQGGCKVCFLQDASSITAVILDLQTLVSTQPYSISS